MEHDFSNYKYANDGDTASITEPSDDVFGKTPVFSSQEEFAKAYSQCKEFNISHRTSLLLHAEPIVNDFNDKTDDEVKQILYGNYSADYKLVDYEDILIGLMLDYQLYITAINGNQKVFDEVKDEIIPDESTGYSRDEIRENKYDLYEFVGGQQEHMYCYLCEEFGLGDEVVRCFLTENETDEYNKLTDGYKGDDKEIVRKRQLLIMLAGVRLARKLVEEYKDFA